MRRLTTVCAAFAFVTLWAAGPSARAVPDVTRMWFTPTVIPNDYTLPVRFEASITNSPATVAFEYNGVDRPMYDDGTNGDQVAGDGTWTVQFTPAEIMAKLTDAWVYRPFIGYCKPAGGSKFNIFAEIWTPTIGLASVQSVSATAQKTDYVVNLKVTASELANFDAPTMAQRLYAVVPDRFDFISFVQIAGQRGNRYYGGVRNSTTGLGLPAMNNSAAYGSASRLQGYVVFPLSSLYDGASPGYSHEHGHRWIDHLTGTPYEPGIPHWPKGDIATNLMGLSIPGSGAGGTFPYTFTPQAGGGYLVGAGNPADQIVFNAMELYLMGLVPPADVPTYFVLKDQNMAVTPGQQITSAQVTKVSVSDVIAVVGARSPTSTAAQRMFHVATVILSEQLLDQKAMSLYDWFARRAEAETELTCATGLISGATCKPFHLATGGLGWITTGLGEGLAPSFTELTPPSGSVTGGTPVLITGQNFRAGVRVSIGGFLATDVVVVNATTITAKTPPRASTGSVAVTVTNADLLGWVEAFAYTYTSAHGAFLDDPLHARVTRIKAEHILELRRDINDLQTRYGVVLPLRWSVITAGTTPVLATHIAELRARLDDLYQTVGLPAPHYARTIVAGSTVAAADVAELRTLILALW
jgi:hypothetical protein